MISANGIPEEKNVVLITVEYKNFTIQNLKNTASLEFTLDHAKTIKLKNTPLIVEDLKELKKAKKNV